MHALLYKDFRVMWKQMKAFLLLIAIFCLIPNQALNLSAFFVVYAGLMLPMSLMSYDERAKWDTFAAMLPYASREIVLSRYLGGWLCVALQACCTPSAVRWPRGSPSRRQSVWFPWAGCLR